MGELDGKVAIITGAGRGLGREHALLFAREGARVVVNDLGAELDGTGHNQTPAAKVVDEIADSGGLAVASYDNVSSWTGAKRLIQTAIDNYGGLDILVNNAGVVRNGRIEEMTEVEWDTVVDVHLKGHFCSTHWAATYWRDQKQAGRTRQAAIVNTTSGAGLFGNTGQINYAAAKAGIAAMTIVEARELATYGVRCNAIAPIARTRLTESVWHQSDRIKAPGDSSVFDRYDPAHVSPLVVYLASDNCSISGQVFTVVGGVIIHNTGWGAGELFKKSGRWKPDELHSALKNIPIGPPPFPS